MTPPDLAALARELVYKLVARYGLRPKSESLHIAEVEEYFQAVATLSRAAGRAEGLEEAAELAEWHQKEGPYNPDLAASIRALASDPAPGEQCPIGGHPGTCSAGTCAACHAAYRAAHPVEPAPGEQVAEVERVARAICFVSCQECHIHCQHVGQCCDWAACKGEAEAAIAAMAPTHPTEPGEVERFRSALVKIDAIRNSIIGFQKINWSEHIYPLVAALGEAGFPGEEYEVARENVGTLIEQIKAAETEIERLRALETAAREYRRLVWKTPTVENQRARSEAGFALDDALSTPQPKGET